MSTSHSFRTKLSIYCSLIRLTLLYCSQVWRLHLVKDIKSFEKVQRLSTKFILGDYISTYNDCFITLHLLHVPLSLWMECLDITFLIRCLKDQSSGKHFEIFNYMQLISSKTRSSSSYKLKCTIPPSKHSYNQTNFINFRRVVILWNSLPIIDLEQSTDVLKKKFKKFLWNHFLLHFNTTLTCTWFHTCPCSNCTHKHVHNYTSHL